MSCLAILGPIGRGVFKAIPVVVAWGLGATVVWAQPGGLGLNAQGEGPRLERRGGEAWHSDMRESLLTRDRATPVTQERRRMTMEERQALREAVRDAYGERRARPDRQP